LILLKDCLIKIQSYNHLLNQLDDMRNRKFSFDSQQDTKMIFELWKSLKNMNQEPEAKITKRWSEIGFQGSIK
jgi:hypothetical protein